MLQNLSISSFCVSKDQNSSNNLQKDDQAFSNTLPKEDQFSSITQPKDNNSIRVAGIRIFFSFRTT